MGRGPTPFNSNHINFIPHDLLYAPASHVVCRGVFLNVDQTILHRTPHSPFFGDPHAFAWTALTRFSYAESDGVTRGIESGQSLTYEMSDP